MTYVLGSRRGPGPLRVGIINIMPRAESYEPYLTRALARGPGGAPELSWIRLESHPYSSSDREHIARAYLSFDQVMSGQDRGTAGPPLDGLILTGAPVEELDYERVTYWPELVQILGEARQRIPSTLGLCWGGMALGKLLGVEKQPLPRKLFGVFANRNLQPGAGLLASGDDRFWCAQSRHAGLPDQALESARDAGIVRLLAHGAEAGYSIFESADRRYVAHLGHPEYEPGRLLEEWRRDLALGRTDVAAPSNLDLEAPVNTWRSHATGFFGEWLALLAATRATADAERQDRTVRIETVDSPF